MVGSVLKPLLLRIGTYMCFLLLFRLEQGRSSKYRVRYSINKFIRCSRKRVFVPTTT